MENITKDTNATYVTVQSGGIYIKELHITVARQDEEQTVTTAANEPKLPPTAEQRISIMAWVLPQIINEITNQRMWFPVYRACVDASLIDKSRFTEFSNLIQQAYSSTLPYPINVQDLSRMENTSYNKSINQWDCNDAPVQGKRFNDNQHIGEKVKKLIQQKLDER
ncbi:MAG: hypothetical protein KBT15_10565 [Bacteroidales bacterium]|nr:hypothetical protein [Candidatus Minthousia equi]